MIDERHFLSLYSHGARAVLCYIQQVEGRIADAEARVEHSHHSLVARLSREPDRAKTTFAGKTPQLIAEQRHENQPRTRRLQLEHVLNGKPLPLAPSRA